MRCCCRLMKAFKKSLIRLCLKNPPDFNMYLYRSQKMRPREATFQKRQADPRKTQHTGGGNNKILRKHIPDLNNDNNKSVTVEKKLP